MREVAWHTRAADDVLRELETDLERGLTQQEAERRLERYGPNAIQRRESDPWWRVLLGQFLDPLIYILLIAAAVSLAFQEQIDAIVILVVVVLNAAIGFTQEWRARRAIEALQEMTAPKATVVRDGEEREIDGDGVVPGDVVILTAGGSVPADVRIARARDLRVDESALTGESHPVQKAEDAVEDEHAVPGDQIGMSFAGTTVVRGRGRGVVVRTGDASELGQIAEAAHAVGEVKTPVQEKMEQLAKLIGYAIAILAVIVVAGGALFGHAARRDRAYRGGADRGRHPRGAAHRPDGDARRRRAAHGQTQRHHAFAAGGGDARLDDGGGLRQDGHAHRQPHDGEHGLGRGRTAPLRSARRRVRGGRPPGGGRRCGRRRAGGRRRWRGRCRRRLPRTSTSTSRRPSPKGEPPRSR
jgi:hypothetical protein